MRRRFPQLLANLLLAAFSVAIAYAIADVAYRVLKYRNLASGETDATLWVMDAPLYRFSPRTGFGYRPDARVWAGLYDGDQILRSANTIRTDPHGRVGLDDALRAKPPDRFRIAVLGDSFAASVNQDRPWPSLLGRALDRDDVLKRRLGVDSVDVVNFGLDGTGIVQWESVLRHEALDYDPDLILVNFIRDDIRRDFVWRGMVALEAGNLEYQALLICGSPPVTLDHDRCAFGRTVAVDPEIARDPHAIGAIRRHVYAEQARRLDWTTPHPELLARATGYRWLPSRLQRSWGRPLFEDDQVAVTQSAEALRAIAGAHPEVLILHNPGHLELRAGGTPPLVRQLEVASRLEIIPMVEYMPPVTDAAIERWFLLPHDGHFSNRGGEMYAAAVHRMLRARLLGVDAGALPVRPRDSREDERGAARAGGAAPGAARALRSAATAVSADSPASP